MRVDNVFAFIYERHQLYLRRQAGQPKPWTADKILQQFRFTNVYRELDAVTLWIAKNWRADVPDLWFAMTVARLFNQPATLQAIGYPLPFKPEKMLRAAQLRKAAGELVFNAAYIVSTNGRAMNKDEYVIRHVLAPLWAERKSLRPRSDDTLRSFFQRLTQFQGVGGFIGGQVIADVKQVQLKKANDWWTWAASGPGSRRGLNRVCAQPVKAPWLEEEWLAQLQLLQIKLAPMLREAKMPRMCAQDTQSACCCEFDKYERVRLGEGRPKQLYR